MIIGNQQIKYSIDFHWAKLPPDILWGMVHGVVEDQSGNIYIQHTVNEASQNKDYVVVFSPEGEFIRSFGKDVFGFPHGLHYLYENEGEFLLHTDQKKGLIKTDLQGNIVWQFFKPDFYQLRPELNYLPSNVAVGSDGTIFLADGYGSYFITKLDYNGNELLTFGGPGYLKENLIHPHGLIVDSRFSKEELVVAYNINSKIPKSLCQKYQQKSHFHIFDLDGNFLREEHGHSEMELPRHFHIRDELMVVPDFKNKLYVFKGWDLVLSLGSEENIIDPNLFDGCISFLLPHAAWIDTHKNIYLTEFGGRVIKFTCCF